MIDAVKTVNDRIGLLVPDGVGVRNFVLGPFLRELSADTDVHNIHIIPEEMLGTYRSELNGHVHWHPLKPLRERPLPFLLRSSLTFGQMHWVNSFAMRYRLGRPIQGSWRHQLVTRAARTLGKVAARTANLGRLDAVHLRLVNRFPEVRHYRELLEEIRPSVLFCSHQRPPEVLPPVLAARSLGIPTATFIFSWDNLTSKGRITAPFDHYLVWSELMRKELLQFYPDVRDDQVHVVGTPQFDPYADESLQLSREDFLRQIGADPERPLICYSGGDAGNAPDDPEHVRSLLQSIRDGRIRGNPQVILRPTPVDEGDRYASVRRDYPELIFGRPAWHHAQPGNWARSIPLPDDIPFLANLTRHADLNVNFGSTMTLDFGLHDRPVVNIAFDISDPPPFGVSLWDYQQAFEHYHPVIKFGAARFARSADELCEHVNAYLDDPSLDRQGRRELVDLQVGVPIGESSRRIISVLREIAARR